MEPKIAIELIQTGKLSTEEILQIGKEVKDQKVWQEIIQQIDWSKFEINEMLKIGKEANDPNVWQKIVQQIKSGKFKQYEDHRG
ncbi:MAG: hypothetical protein KBC42_03700 [Candidatus Pacebacteria bacterium]|nr:hypothetical protein [Candidatus Paceibacterota bacterium]MBP9781000.1 hypothetical protein [Candidatus Paceibacterota bacterium]